MDRETKIFLGKCLMLTQKIPDRDALENILSTIRQQTPTCLPPEWCKQLFIREDNIRDAKRLFIKLKRDVARDSLNRLEDLIKNLKSSAFRTPLIDVLESSKREESSMGIEMVPVFSTAIAMIEIAKENRIPVCFHVLNAVFHQDNIEVLKWDLIFYMFNQKFNRFEKSQSILDASKLVIVLKNIWYEGSDPSGNYGEDFLDRSFNMENYIETWKSHPELSTRLTDLRQRFLQTLEYNKHSGFDFPGSREYLKLKEMGNSSEEISRMSFMCVTHVYASTAGVEMKRSVELNTAEWKPCRIEAKPVRVAEEKFANKRYWEKSRRLERVVSTSGGTRKMSLQLAFNRQSNCDRFRKYSLMNRRVIEEDENEEEL